MKKNEVYEIDITGTTDDGDGVGRIDDFPIFVSGALLGERVRVHILKVLKKYAFGKLIEVINPIEQRAEPECKYFSKCGGCTFWNCDYEHELSYKQKKVEDCLIRLGGIQTQIEKIRGCVDYKHYRNKAQFPVTPYGIGIYARNSHNVVDMNNCLIQDKVCRQILECIRMWMEKNDISAYDEVTDTGVIRHIYIRSGDSGVQICLVTRTKKIYKIEKLIADLKKLDIRISGVVQNINAKQTNVVLGDETKLIYGEKFLEDSIGDIKFKISPLSFYQVNKKQTKVLYDIAKEFADLGGNETVWDLYCGAGTIGLYLADKAKRIIGVEVVEDAVKNARENAKLNDITNAEFYCGSAEKTAPKLLEKGLKPDIVILDPPRKGCAELLIRTVVETNVEKVIYISCKPSTLARDLKYFEQHGYKTIKAVPVDMFPRTPHVECVVLMSRIEK